MLVDCAHGGCASRVHGILVELASAYRSICIDVHAFELAVVRVGHDLALWIGRLREELLLRGAGLVLHRLLHRGLVAHVAVDRGGCHWVDLLLLQEGGVGALAADGATNAGRLVKLIREKPVGLADEVDVRLLRPALPNGAVSPRSDTEPTFVRREVHLLLLWSLKQRSRRTRASSQVCRIPAVAHFLHYCLLRVLSDHLLVGSLHVPS